MSKQRPLRVINEFGTPIAVHADAATVYRLHGKNAVIERYDDGTPYEGVTVERLHLRATNPEKAAEMDKRDEEKAEADRKARLAAEKKAQDEEAARAAAEADQLKAEEDRKKTTTTTTTQAPGA